jgi:hypothetical protein
MKDNAQMISNTATDMVALFKSSGDMSEQELNFEIQARLGEFGLDCSIGTVESIIGGTDCPKEFSDSILPALDFARKMKGEYSKLRGQFHGA